MRAPETKRHAPRLTAIAVATLLPLLPLVGCGQIQQTVSPQDAAVNDLNQRDYNDAIAILTQLHQSSPDDAQTTILLASAYAGAAGFDVVSTIGAFSGSLFAPVKNPLAPGLGLLDDDAVTGTGTAADISTDPNALPTSLPGEPVTPSDAIAIGPAAVGGVLGTSTATTVSPNDGDPTAFASSVTGTATATGVTPTPPAGTPAAPAAPATPAPATTAGGTPALPNQSATVQALGSGTVNFLGQLTSEFKTLSGIPFTSVADRRNLVQALLLLATVADGEDPTQHTLFVEADTYAAVLNALQFLNYVRDAMTTVVNKPNVGFLDLVCALDVHTFFENLDTSTGYLLSSVQDLTISYQEFGKTLPGKLGQLSHAAVQANQVYSLDQTGLSDADLAFATTKSQYCGPTSN